MLYTINFVGIGISIISFFLACILYVYMRIVIECKILAASTNFYQDKIDELKSSIQEDNRRYKIFKYIEWSLCVTNSILGILLMTNYICNHIDSNIIGLSGVFVVLASILQILIKPNKVKYYYRLRIIRQQQTLRQCEEYIISGSKSLIPSKDIQVKIIHLINDCFNKLDALEVNNI